MVPPQHLLVARVCARMPPSTCHEQSRTPANTQVASCPLQERKRSGRRRVRPHSFCHPLARLARRTDWPTQARGIPARTFTCTPSTRTHTHNRTHIRARKKEKEGERAMDRNTFREHVSLTTRVTQYMKYAPTPRHMLARAKLALHRTHMYSQAICLCAKTSSHHVKPIHIPRCLLNHVLLARSFTMAWTCRLAMISRCYTMAMQYFSSPRRGHSQEFSCTEQESADVPGETRQTRS